MVSARRVSAAHIDHYRVLAPCALAERRGRIAVQELCCTLLAGTPVTGWHARAAAPGCSPCIAATWVPSSHHGRLSVSEGPVGRGWLASARTSAQDK